MSEENRLRETRPDPERRPQALSNSGARARGVGRRSADRQPRRAVARAEYLSSSSDHKSRKG